MKMNKQTRPMSIQKQLGFTLIEIATVLVIIGLLLGGVLKGQELVNSAKVRSLSNKISGITSAYYGFQERFKALPGDYSRASTTLSLSGVNGDSDSIIETGELSMVWAHLAAAGFISGSYPGTTTLAFSTGSEMVGCSVGDCPDNGFGSGMLIGYTNVASGTPGDSHELVLGKFVPSNILFELDQKIDDGLATSGSLRTHSTYQPSCVNTDDYQVVNTVNDCTAVLRNL